jgi:hypothetical protein
MNIFTSSDSSYDRNVIILISGSLHKPKGRAASLADTANLINRARRNAQQQLSTALLKRGHKRLHKGKIRPYPSVP